MAVAKARLSTRGPALPNPLGSAQETDAHQWSHACSHQVQVIYWGIFFFFSFALGLPLDCKAKEHNPTPENTSSFLPHLSHNLPHLHHLQTFLQKLSTLCACLVPDKSTVCWLSGDSVVKIAAIILWFKEASCLHLLSGNKSCKKIISCIEPNLVIWELFKGWKTVVFSLMFCIF